MNVRKYEKKDIPALIRIWNEVVDICRIDLINFYIFHIINKFYKSF